MTMTSAPPNASTSGGKSLNISTSHSTLPQHQAQSGHSNFEASAKRPSGTSSVPFQANRNLQGHKKNHKSSRRPGLANEDAMAESRILRNVNGRRGQTSITHLMNFSLPPRPQDHRVSMGRGTRRGNTFGIGSGHHSSDKARYIHANYRFIVKPTGDYSQQATNADLPLDWSDVLQILASAESQASACPICLSHPVAPRMAKCGHIFCLPCLIRYMYSDDEEKPVPEKKSRWKACPICWDSIYQADTRPVRWFTGQESPAPREGEDVVLRLVRRDPGSTLALPRDGAEALPKLDDVPWYFAAEVTDYARIMKGTEEYMAEQYDIEIEQLRLQEAEDEVMFGEGPEWTRKAVKAVYKGKESIKDIGNQPIPKSPVQKAPKKPPIQFKPTDENNPETYFLQYTSKSGLDLTVTPSSPISIPTIGQASVTQLTMDDRNPGTTTNSHETSPHHSRLNQARPKMHEGHHPDTPYYFYQALLHYYLAPLDIRILRTAFGDFSTFPSTLLPRVERVSCGNMMDEDLRKRTKYLSHLPYGCEVGFLECNWTDVVDPTILDQFKEEIERRRKRNRDKETREEKDRVRAEKAEDDARWANTRRKRLNIPPEGLLPENIQEVVSSSLDASNASPPWPSRQGSLFGPLASPSTSPSAPRTVWGTAVVAPASPEIYPHQSDLGVDDGWLSWEAELAAENELLARVQAASLHDNGEASGSSTLVDKSSQLGSEKGQGQGKKKKAKKITLMSTTARRAA